MLGSAALSFFAGLITILNPCVLPLVPLVVTSALSKSRYGPLALASGLVTSFTIFGFVVIAFGYSLGINESFVRLLAGSLLAVSGFVLLVPQAQAALSAAAAPLSNFGNRHLETLGNGGSLAEGAQGQFLIGLLLGLVWAPCVGPTLGVAIAAASQGQDLASSFMIFFIFGLGVATSILAFAYGSRRALSERRDWLARLSKYGKPLLGWALIIVGTMVVTGFDKAVEALLLDILPSDLIRFTTRF